jgi:hypothetical protein
MLCERSKLTELPTDLAGITAVTFEVHSSGNLGAALGAAATKLKQQIQRLGLRERRDSSRVVHFNLGVNLGWLQQGAEFGDRPISLMAADLERVRATAANAMYTDNQSAALITAAQRKLELSQRGEGVLAVIIDLITMFHSQVEGIVAAALSLGVVLGRLQQGALANHFPLSLATSNLELARTHASRAGYHSYNGFVDNALTKLFSGQSIIAILLEVTHLIGLFQGQL